MNMEYFLITKPRSKSSFARSVVSVSFNREEANKRAENIKDGRVFRACALTDMLLDGEHEQYTYVNNGGYGIVVDMALFGV
jgi:hypothetical protein